MQSKTILITGSTDGLGHGIMLDLARRGHVLLLHGRDATRLESAATEARNAGTSDVRSYLADLSSIHEVDRMAAQIMARETKLHALVANAGIGTNVPGGESRAVSRDGYELRFAVNYLSHYALTNALTPLLVASAPARIINVSSAGQAAIDFDDPMIEQGYSGTRAYCQSKLCQITDTFRRAGMLASAKVTVTALHPATYMPTKIVPHPMSSLKEGVDATAHLIDSRDTEGVTGKYYDGLRAARAQAQAYDEKAQARLFELSEHCLAKARG